jgi:hypothetical protein
VTSKVSVVGRGVPAEPLGKRLTRGVADVAFGSERPTRTGVTSYGSSQEEAVIMKTTLSRPRDDVAHLDYHRPRIMMPV